MNRADVLIIGLILVIVFSRIASWRLDKAIRNNKKETGLVPGGMPYRYDAPGPSDLTEEDYH